MKLSLIIPAKNESKRIVQPLVKLYTTLASVFPENEFEIIVAINNTSDDSQFKVERLKEVKSLNALRVINLGKTEGKGEAVIRAFSQAKGEIIGFIDADGSSAPVDVLKMVRMLQTDKTLDAAISSRYEKGSLVVGDIPEFRKMLTILFNRTVKILFGTNYADTQCGLKLFKAEAIKQVIPFVKAYGWAFDVNILAVLGTFGLKTVEVPGTWIAKTGSTLKIFSTLFSVLRDFAHINKVLWAIRVDNAKSFITRGLFQKVVS